MQLYRFGDFELDISDESLRRDGVKLPLNRRMFQVLCLLIERQGELIGKNEFFETVWKGDFVEDNNLTVTVTALRKVLGDDAKRSRFIENIPRKGYRFVGEITKSSTDATAEPLQDERTDSALISEQPTIRFLGRPIAIGVAVTMIVLVSIVSFGHKTFWPASGSLARPIDSLAVLPFADAATESEYLADGLTEGIISDISSLKRLRVIDRNSAFRYRKLPADLSQVGRDLNVRAILTGRIERHGDSIIVSVEMFDPERNAPIWQHEFRGTSHDLFAIQQEISGSITKSVLSDTAGIDMRRLSKRPTNDREAYDLYLKGRFYWNKRSNPEILKSIEMFRAAIDRDPTFSRAYTGLADAYTLGNLSGISNEEKIALSRGAAQKALEIDDTIGEAYASLAINKCYYDWNFPGAESDYRKAVDLSPNDATAHHWYAEFLSMQGRFDESYAEYEKALALDPLSMAIRTDLAFARYYARDYDKAIDLLIQAKHIEPNYRLTYTFLMFAYREKGMFFEAADAYEQAKKAQYSPSERSGKGFNKVMRHIAEIKKQGSSLDAERYWRAELEFEDDPSPIYKAVTHINLGEADKAFEYLEQAFKARYSGMVWLKVSPEFDRIRSDPRFSDLLKRVGFDPS